MLEKSPNKQLDLSAEDYSELKRKEGKTNSESENSSENSKKMNSSDEDSDLSEFQNNTRKIKPKFNLNFFLNEQCKDALNINE